ncbi:DUF4145 domain-containing protein [Acinetobacter nosocomialis]|uniref:DUF4145 domain-containing protein n=1 Tax=Acinetobacter nosocomialis TaxID=106654 RepID=UPI001FD71137|nr:DUF4145 domain-containing protein [Acinetobacter nosocomialis]
MNFTPQYKSEKFQCPHCKTLSQQQWFDSDLVSNTFNETIKNTFFEYRTRIPSAYQEIIKKFIDNLSQINKTSITQYVPEKFAVATCSSCLNFTVWVDYNLIYPAEIYIDPPNTDMEQNIQNLYLEAVSIVKNSPKGATALLRLALQLLLKQLGKSGKNINNDIKELVSEGLSPKIQQALDLLRVVGNNAVHPGQIDINDDNEIAIKLFHILNFIANEMITKPKELEFLYSSIIPEDTKQHIKDRDGT